MDYCIAGNQSWLLVVFPRHKDNIVGNIWCTAVACKIWKFLAVWWVGLMTHGKCRVDCLCPYTSLGVGWESSPPQPPQYRQWIAYLTHFLALNPQYPETLSHGLVFGTTGSNPSSSSSPSFLSSASSPRVRVSNLLFFIHGIFTWWAAFCPFFSQTRAAFQLSFLVNMSWE